MGVIWEDWLAALYPPRCALCGVAAEGGACSAHALPARDASTVSGLPGSRCGRCARRVPPGIPDGATCADCRRRRPAYARVVALSDYRRPRPAARGTNPSSSDPEVAESEASARAWVLALKYGRRPDLAAWLGAALEARLQIEPDLGPGVEPDLGPGVEPDLGPGVEPDLGPGVEPDLEPRGARTVLVPVPLHRWRRVERGYDQAALLARAVEQAGGPRSLAILRRTRATPPQGGPGSRSRRANVRGAFALRRGFFEARLERWIEGACAELAGARVWLVDDVVASGSTAHECARVLRRAGSGPVGVLAVARGSADPGD